MLRSILAMSFVLALVTGSAALAQGNRYNLPRLYHSEISAAEAYVLTSHDNGNRSKDAFARAILIDVRDVAEYSAGHPDLAVHLPYPHINARPGNSAYVAMKPEDFVAAVRAAVPNLDTPIFTLCRTGQRSVLAANLLAQAGYTKVRNIWQGFFGNHMTDVAGNVVDLNNDGVINDADRDGWQNFQGLPYSTKLHPELVYAPYAYLYP